MATFYGHDVTGSVWKQMCQNFQMQVDTYGEAMDFMLRRGICINVMPEEDSWRWTLFYKGLLQTTGLEDKWHRAMDAALNYAEDNLITER